MFVLVHEKPNNKILDTKRGITMDSLSIKAVLTGILFGAWPLLMNRSGLGGNISSLVLVIVMLLVILPFSIGDFGEIFNANLMFAVGAAVLGAAGILLLNGILFKASPQNLGPLLVLVFVAQIVVSSIYHVVVTGGITVTKGIGFALAVITAILLNL